MKFSTKSRRSVTWYPTQPRKSVELRSGLVPRAQLRDKRGVIAREDGFLTKDARILANARLIDGRKRGVGRAQHVERTGEPNRAFESLAKARFVSRVSLQNLDEHLAPCLRSLELDKQSPDANTLFECCR